MLKITKRSAICHTTPQLRNKTFCFGAFINFVFWNTYPQIYKTDGFVEMFWTELGNQGHIQIVDSIFIG